MMILEIESPTTIPMRAGHMHVQFVHSPPSAALTSAQRGLHIGPDWD
jgi:hypothetical protein